MDSGGELGGESSGCAPRPRWEGPGGVGARCGRAGRGIMWIREESCEGRSRCVPWPRWEGRGGEERVRDAAALRGEEWVLAAAALGGEEAVEGFVALWGLEKVQIGPLTTAKL